MCFFCGLLGCLGVWNGAESISIGVWLYLPSSIAGIDNSRTKVNRGLVLLNTDLLWWFVAYSRIFLNIKERIFFCFKFAWIVFSFMGAWMSPRGSINPKPYHHQLLESTIAELKSTEVQYSWTTLLWFIASSRIPQHQGENLPLFQIAWIAFSFMTAWMRWRATIN